MINNYFVPVYVANEDLGRNGKLPAEEKTEVRRIYTEAANAGWNVGSVCVYIAGPDGRALDALKVPEVTSSKTAIALLQKTIDRLKLKEGKVLVKPTAQSVAPKAEPDALILHVVVRENHAARWQPYPAENWLTFTKAEWTKFLPPPAGGSPSTPLGTGWDVDPAVARKLLTFFYPGTEDTHSNQIDRNVIEKATISAKAVSGRTVRLEAVLKMTRPFYPGHPEHKPVSVEATAIGFVEIDPSKSSIRSFRMTTEQARFGGKDISVAVSTEEVR